MFSPDTPGGRLRRRIAIGAALSVATAATVGAAAAGIYAHMNTGAVPAGPVSLQWPQPLPPPSATMPEPLPDPPGMMPAFFQRYKRRNV